jgi:hypothetical protein
LDRNHIIRYLNFRTHERSNEWMLQNGLCGEWMGLICCHCPNMESQILFLRNAIAFNQKQADNRREQGDLSSCGKRTSKSIEGSIAKSRMSKPTSLWFQWIAGSRTVGSRMNSNVLEKLLPETAGLGMAFANMPPTSSYAEQDSLSEISKAAEGLIASQASVQSSRRVSLVAATILTVGSSTRPTFSSSTR